MQTDTATRPSESANTKNPSHPLAVLRRGRGLSQLELSLRSGVSQRHLSCIETGRALPSRVTLLALLDTLDASLAERNAALLAAGLAPQYSQLTWSDDKLQPARDALATMLNAPGAAPAMVIDAQWNVVLANAGVTSLLALLGLSMPMEPLNLLDWMFEGALRGPLLNAEEVLPDVRSRVAREAAHVPALKLRLASMDVQLAALTQRTGTGSGSAAGRASPSTPQAGPVLLTRLRAKDGSTLSLLSMFSSFGSPMDITLASLRIEHLFAADVSTAAALQRGPSRGA